VQSAGKVDLLPCQSRDFRRVCSITEGVIAFPKAAPLVVKISAEINASTGLLQAALRRARLAYNHAGRKSYDDLQ
jgi:hypothetical protein